MNSMDFFDRREAYRYLFKVTNYSKETLDRIPDYRLEKMVERIKGCMSTYHLDILRLMDENPNSGIHYTPKEISEMNYNKLAKVRKQLLSYARQAAKNSIICDQITMDELFNTSAIVSENKTQSLIEEEQVTDDYEYLTTDEIALLFAGAEDLSDSELRQMGVINIDHSPDDLEAKDELDIYEIKMSEIIDTFANRLNYAIKATIVDSGYIINGVPATYAMCISLPKEKLLKYYADAKKLISRKEESPNLTLSN